MSIALICPGCQVATTFHRSPISACPNCQSAFPPALREPAEAALARQEAPQPVLITIGRFAAPGLGTLWLFLLGMALMGSGRFSINGEAVSAGEFLRRVGLGWGLAGATCLAAGIGIWRERAWARPMMIAFWLIVSALLLGLAISLNGISVVVDLAYGITAVGGAAWYLYGKENVVAYYRALEMRGRVGVTRAPDDL